MANEMSNAQLIRRFSVRRMSAFVGIVAWWAIFVIALLLAFPLSPGQQTHGGRFLSGALILTISGLAVAFYTVRVLRALRDTTAPGNADVARMVAERTLQNRIRVPRLLAMILVLAGLTVLSTAGFSQTIFICTAALLIFRAATILRDSQRPTIPRPRRLIR